MRNAIIVFSQIIYSAMGIFSTSIRVSSRKRSLKRSSVANFDQRGIFDNQIVATAVWKFKNFFITMILREINFGDCRSSKTVFFAIIKALNFLILVIFSPQEVQNSWKSKFRVSQFVEMADFERDSRCANFDFA